MRTKNEVRGMKINEVEALVGITRKNIRFYESEGLLTPRRNSENGYRDYGEGEVRTLLQIKLMRKLGVSLEDLDAAGILTEMETMEQSGTTFQNKQKKDLRIRYVAPVAITTVMVLLMGGVIGLVLWIIALGVEDAPPVLMLLILALAPLVIIGGVVLALVQRIREIGRGEIDDAKNY